MKDIVIVDIDGTVSKVGDRLKYLKATPKNWDAFYDACDQDDPVEEIVELVRLLARDYTVIFCTSRREGTRKKTQSWLTSHGLEGELIMRPEKDYRHDTIVKPMMLAECGVVNENIAFVLEDRDSMVKYWREQGVKCLQVEYGDF